VCSSARFPALSSRALPAAGNLALQVGSGDDRMPLAYSSNLHGDEGERGYGVTRYNMIY